jgi:hypothetical protein
MDLWYIYRLVNIANCQSIGMRRLAHIVKGIEKIISKSKAAKRARKWPRND